MTGHKTGHTMGHIQDLRGCMKEIEELCKALKEKSLKSKQATFNHYYDDFCAAKDLYGWESVVRFINAQTGDNLAVAAYKSMYKRAKKKVSVPAGNKKFTQLTKIAERQTGKALEQRGLIQENDNPDSLTLQEYLKVCFNSESIAKRAIDAGVSVDEIKIWNCPNQIRLGTTLSNYIRNK